VTSLVPDETGDVSPFSVRTDLISRDFKFIMLQIPCAVDVSAFHIACSHITFRNVTDIIRAGMSVPGKSHDRPLFVWLMPQ
jgi:hypothetical protein